MAEKKPDAYLLACRMEAVAPEELPSPGILKNS
jgi:hypothetical protein